MLWIAAALLVLGASGTAGAQEARATGTGPRCVPSAILETTGPALPSLNPKALPAGLVAQIPEEILAPLVGVATGQPLASVRIEGTLLDSRDELEAALASELQVGRPFDVTTAQRLAYKLCQLEYVPTPSTFVEGTGLRLLLELEPQLIVRSVKVSYSRRRVRSLFYNPFFDQEILARASLQLHAGSLLPAGAGLGDVIKAAEDSLSQFLQANGYFDARVSIEVRRGEAPNEADIVVDLQGVSQVYEIGQILVSGNRALTSDEFRSIVAQRSWYWPFPPAYSRERIRGNIETILAEYRARGYPSAYVDFPTLDIDRLHKRVNLAFHAHEGRPIQVHFYADGTEADSGDLRGAVTLFRSGGSDEAALQESARGLVHYFQTQGYLEARVTFRRMAPTNPEDPVRVDFFVTRGPERRVRSVRFAGNTAVSSEALAGQINTRVYSFWGGGYATADGVAGDVEIIQQALENEGYPESNVAPELATDPRALGLPGALSADVAAGVPGGENLYVEYRISEGPRALVGRVTITGNESLPTPTLQDALKLMRSERPYSKDAARQDAVELVRAYYPTGLLVSVDVTGRPEPDGVHEDVTYHIDEGPRAVMGHLFVRGNFHTSDRILRRDFPLRPGQPYDPGAIDNYRSVLSGAGLPVSHRVAPLVGNVEVTPLGYRENPVDVLVHVTELYDDYGTYSFELGYSSDQCLNDQWSWNCLYAGASAVYSNLFGRGWRLRLRGESGLQTFALQPSLSRLIDGSATFTNPRLFDTYLQLDATVFGRVQQTIALGRVTTYGARLTLSERVTDDLTVNALYDFERINHPEDAVRPSGLLEGESQVIVPTQFGELGAGFLYDRRWREDHNDVLRKIVPDGGWYVQAQGSAALPELCVGDCSAFAILHVQGGLWQPLPIGFKLGTGFTYDHGLPLGGSSLLPKAVQFFAGGSTTLRGYLQDEFKRQIVQYEVPGAPGLLAYRVIPVGGNIRGVGHLELMRPFGAWIPVLFLDAGYLTDSYNGFTAADVGEDVGAGIRYTFGGLLLSLEYAIPVPDLENSSIVPWRISVPLGDYRQPTFGYLIPGRLLLNFNYIY